MTAGFNESGQLQKLHEAREFRAAGLAHDLSVFLPRETVHIVQDFDLMWKVAPSSQLIVSDLTDAESLDLCLSFVRLVDTDQAGSRVICSNSSGLVIPQFVESVAQTSWKQDIFDAQCAHIEDVKQKGGNVPSVTLVVPKLHHEYARMFASFVQASRYMNIRIVFTCPALNVLLHAPIDCLFLDPTALTSEALLQLSQWRAPNNAMWCKDKNGGPVTRAKDDEFETRVQEAQFVILGNPLVQPTRWDERR